MARAVYLLCALTSIGCATMLLRTYIERRTRLLLWSSLCFVGFALNNALLYFDLAVVPTIDLSLVRGLPSLAGVTLLLYGLIWDSR